MRRRRSSPPRKKIGRRHRRSAFALRTPLSALRSTQNKVEEPMSILVNKNTKVITQGITGKTGQFHTRMCRDYANGRNCFVAGVNPKKAGEDFEGIPIYASVKDAAKRTGATVS